MAIFNVGSINIDHVYSVDRLPTPGETISSTGLFHNLGGKGMNVSLAVQRMGTPIHHVGLIGNNDPVIDAMLAETGLDTALIKTVDTSTGHAIIYVDSHSENQIVIHGGANQMFTRDIIESCLASAAPDDWLLLQNETNANEIAIEVARQKGMKIALVAAPFCATTLPSQIKAVDLVTMNQTETDLFEAAIGTSISTLTGTEFLLTQGSKGAEFHANGTCHRIDAHKVTAIDTTGAGDTFFGAFMADYTQGKPVETALETANAAAAVMVQRKGAAAAIPSRADVADFLANI